MKERLIYDQETGVVSWSMDSRNKFPGGVAGCVAPTGYWVLMYGGSQYRRSRVAWLLMTGEWPMQDIDHKDRDTVNDRWDNLRSATESENMANAKVRCDNTSGARGVSWNFRLGSWHVRVNVDRQLYHIGYFDDFDEAVRARDEAAAKLHGEFAHLNNPLTQGV